MCDWRLSHFTNFWEDWSWTCTPAVSEHYGRSFFFHFFIEIENFRGEGKILMRHTHDTTFSETIFDFYKMLEESEQFFILFLLFQRFWSARRQFKKKLHSGKSGASEIQRTNI